MTGSQSSDPTFDLELESNPDLDLDLTMYLSLTITDNHSRPEYELYDRKSDPAETVNVSAKPRYARTLARLSAQVLKKKI